MFEKWICWISKDGKYRIEFHRLVPGWRIIKELPGPADVIDAAATPIIETFKGVIVSKSNGVDPNEGNPYLWGCLLGMGAFLCIIFLLILVLAQN